MKNTIIFITASLLACNSSGNPEEDTIELTINGELWNSVADFNN